jgi:hypothetical protein
LLDYTATAHKELSMKTENTTPPAPKTPSPRGMKVRTKVRAGLQEATQMESRRH